MGLKLLSKVKFGIYHPKTPLKMAEMDTKNIIYWRISHLLGFFYKKYQSKSVHNLAIKHLSTWFLHFFVKKIQKSGAKLFLLPNYELTSVEGTLPHIVIMI